MWKLFPKTLTMVLALLVVSAFSLLQAQSITVLSPNGGEDFKQNASQLAVWKSSGVTGNVKITLSTDGGTTFPITIAASVPNTGYYTWNSGTVNSTTCRLKVESVTNSSINDVSNANFKISGTLDILSDNPFAISDGVTAVAMRFGLHPTATDGIDLALGEAELPPAPPSGVFDGRWVDTAGNANLGQGVLKDYRQGTSTFTGSKVHSVKYQLGTGDSIRLYWSLPANITGNIRDLLGGILVNVNISGTGTYTVPNAILTQLRVQFNYTPPPASITVVSPNGGENWLVGSTQNIVWNQTGVTTVKLEYSTNNGTSWILIGTAPAFTVSKIKDPNYHPKDPKSNLTGTLGTYAWTVPNTPSTQCLVRVSDNSNASVNDVSNNVFTISSTPPPSDNWTVQTSGTTQALYSVSIVDNNVAYIAGTAGTLLKTTNGGTNWVSANTGIPSTHDCNIVFAYNANLVLVGTADASGTAIYRTTNGGTSWTQVYTQAGGFINGIKLFDQNNGFAQGDPVGGTWTLLKTTDGGATWTSAGTLAPGSSTEAGWNNSMYFVNNQVGFFGTNNTRIYKTTNGGANWTSYPTTSLNSFSINFGDVNNGIAGFSTGITNKSTNGGVNWTAGGTAGTASIYGAARLGTSEYYVTSGTNVYKSTDLAGTWTVSHSGTGTNYAIDMKGDATSAVGYVVGASGKIVKFFRGSVTPTITVTSPNGGENWAVGSTQTISWNATGVANVKLEYTTNNGTSWVVIAASTPAMKSVPSLKGSRNIVETDGPLGTYSWVVPNTPSTQCKVRVTDVTNASVTDMSDNVFTISSTPPPSSDTLFYGNAPRCQRSSNGGWVIGPNGYGDLGKAQRFDITGSKTLKAVGFHFGAKQIVGTADNIPLKVWSVGGNGAPGTELYSANITLTNADTAINGSKRTIYQINPPLTVNGPFFVGLEWTSAMNDTFGIVYDDPNVPPAGENQNRGWEKWDTGVWYAISSTSSWGLNSDIWIAAIFEGGTPQPSISITSPNGGENWAVGSTQTISWNATGVTTVKLEYTTNNGTSWILIGTAPALMKSGPVAYESPYETDQPTGTYSWVVPNTPSTQCKVRVSDNSNPAISSVSANTFTISAAPPSGLQFKINVSTLYPGLVSAYGSEFDGNYFYLTQWNSTGGAKIYKINKAGTTIDSALVTGPTGGLRDLAWDGQYLYGSPNSTTIYKIDPTTMTSVGTITAPQSVRGIAYDKARNGLWIANWSTSIQLISMTGTVLQTIAATTHRRTEMSGLAYDTLSSGGPFIWVTDCGVAGNPYKLVKINATTGLPVDSIDITAELHSAALGGGMFITTQYQTGTVTLGGLNQGAPHFLWGKQIGGGTPQPSITVVSPNGGENWVVGSVQNIVWNQTGVTTVKLEYSTNNGTSWILIGTAPAFTTSKVRLDGYNPKDPNGVLTGTLGTYAWTIPNTPSTQCLVRVSDNSNASINDVSNNVFTISSTAPPSENWTVQTSGTTSALYTVVTVDQNVAWAAGGSSAGSGGGPAVVLRTTNGGTTWTSSSPGAFDVFCIEALDANTALIGAYTGSATSIYRTTNGGTNWTQVYNQSGGFINAIKMFDANNGFAQGDPVGGTWTLLKTTNGGATWTSAATLAPGSSTEAGWNNGMYWVNDQIGYFGTNNSRIYKTTNGGANWTPTTTTAVNSYVLTFANATQGMAGFASGVANKTVDGSTWTAVTTPTTASLNGMSNIGVDNYFFSAGNTVYKTTNHGTNWTTSYSGTGTLLHLDIKGNTTSAVGYAVGSNGFIAKYFRGAVQPSITVISPNGGENWAIGSTKQITWNATGVTTVKLEYTTNNGTSWIMIGTAPAVMSKSVNPNTDATELSDDITGTYNWTVPNTPSTQCKVRVSDNSNASIFDVSDNVFTISQQTGPTLAFELNLSTAYPAAVSFYGSEFDGTKFYVTQWNSTGGAKFFRFTKQGQFIDSVLVTGPAGGFRDLAWDGQFLYGSNNSTTIYKIDPTTMTSVGTITAPQTVRGIAYDKARDGFWIANWNTNIQLISRTGTVLQTIPPATHQLSGNAGLAYDTVSAGGPYLWAWNTGATTDAKRIIKLNATTGARVDSIDVSSILPTDAIGGGLWVTADYNPGEFILGGSNQSVPHKIFGYKIATLGPPPATITVLTPKAGDQFKAGALQIIGWRSANYTGNVTIKLSSDGGTTYPTTIATNVPDNGVYAFTLPTTVGSNYKIKVESATTPTVFGESGAFAVVAGTLTSVDLPIVVTDGFNFRYLRFGLHPTASDSIDAALGEVELPPIPPTNVFDARWIGTDINLPKLGQGVLLDYRTGQNQVTNQKLHELYFQRGTGSTSITFYYSLPTGISARIQDNFTELDTVIAGTGKYTVTGTLNKLKFTVNYFPKEITVTAPNGGESWLAGTTRNITWTSSNVTNVKIEYSTNNGTTYTVIAASVPATPASYAWEVPNTPTTQAKVKISDVATPTVFDESNAVFTILGRSITLTQPVGGEVWGALQTKEIKWTSTNVTTVKVEYSTNAGASYTLVGYAPAAAGKVNWVVPNTPTQTARVKVSDSAYASVFSASPNNFTIAPTAPNAFNLVSPANNVTITARQGNNTQIRFVWNKSLYATNYSFRMGSPEVSPSFIEQPSNNGGVDTFFVITEADLYDLLKTLTVGNSLTVKWTVWAYNALSGDSTKATQNNSLTISLVTGVKDNKGIPTTFDMAQNYPNPFNPATRIEYQLPKETNVKIEVFNMVGEKVATLVNKVQEAGYYEITFDAKNLNSGIYLYRMEAGDFVSIKKMILVK